MSTAIIFQTLVERMHAVRVVVLGHEQRMHAVRVVVLRHEQRMHAVRVVVLGHEQRMHAVRVVVLRHERSPHCQYYSSLAIITTTCFSCRYANYF